MSTIITPHENLGDPTWSVIILLLCGLLFTLYCVAYILIMASKEMQDVQESKQGQEGICWKQEAEPRERHSKKS